MRAKSIRLLMIASAFVLGASGAAWAHDSSYERDDGYYQPDQYYEHHEDYGGDRDRDRDDYHRPPPHRHHARGLVLNGRLDLGDFDGGVGDTSPEGGYGGG